jgi:dipeptidase E
MVATPQRLLLFSNSRDAEGHYLHHARAPLAELLRGVGAVTFVPFAGVTIAWDDYTALVAEAFASLGIAVRPLHQSVDPLHAIGGAEAIVVGGGNTFHLLDALQRRGLLDAIRARVRAGAPYVGWSAGAVLAGPTVGTTNDMPIVHPASLDALGLVPFQLNAHFTDAHPPGFRGETRRERLAEYLAVHREATVLGLPEGSWLEVHGDRAVVRGPHAAVRFRYGQAAESLPPGEAA